MEKDNILIAQFMGYHHIHDGNLLFKSNDYPILIPNQLEYHNNWVELMSVVEKIETITKNGFVDTVRSDEKLEQVDWLFTVEIKGNQCMIHRDCLPQFYGTDKDFLKLYSCLKKSKIKSTYEAILKFINYYNSEIEIY